MVAVYCDRLCTRLGYNQKHYYNDRSNDLAIGYRYVRTLGACGGHVVGHFDSSDCINRHRDSSGSIDGRIEFHCRYS